MPSESSQSIVLADCNVAVVGLHRCGHSLVNRLSPVCRLTCVVVSVTVIRYCSLFVLHHAEPTDDGACCLIAEGLMHLSVTKPVGEHKRMSSCQAYSVEFQPLTCVWKDIFHIFLHCTVSWGPKLRVRIHSVWSIKQLVQGNQPPQKRCLSGKLHRELSSFSQSWPKPQKWRLAK